MLVSRGRSRKRVAQSFSSAIVEETRIACALVGDGVIGDESQAFSRMSAEPRRWSAVADAAAGADRGGDRDLRSLVIDQARRFSAGGRPRPARLRFEHADRTIELTLRRPEGGGRGRAVLVEVRDITELARREAELRACMVTLAQRERAAAVGQVALGVAHDLGNFLGALQLRLGVLAANETCRREAGPNLDALLRINGGAKALLERLQTLGREGGAVGPVDLGAVVESAVEVSASSLAVKSAESGGSFRIERDVGRMPLVWGVDVDLRRALVNLFMNALEAMPRGGTVTVEGKNVRQGVILTVADEGPGIPDAHLDKIFDPFFTTKGPSGTGLGLSMVRHLMRRIGGSVVARNRGEGGACFELLFVRVGRARLWDERAVRGHRRPTATVRVPG